MIGITHLDLGVVGDSWLPVSLGRDGYYEDTKVPLFHGVCLSVPVIEVSNEGGLDSIGSPFPVQDAVVGLYVQSKVVSTLE